MKKIVCLSLAVLALVAVSCKKDYRAAIVGNWDAGKASLKSEILVTVRADGTLTTRITNTDMKPLDGTYVLDGDQVTFKFPRLDLPYRILKLDSEVMVLKWKFAKITWHRMK